MPRFGVSFSGQLWGLSSGRLEELLCLPRLSLRDDFRLHFRDDFRVCSAFLCIGDEVRVCSAFFVSEFHLYAFIALEFHLLRVRLFLDDLSLHLGDDFRVCFAFPALGFQYWVSSSGRLHVVGDEFRVCLASSF